MLAPMIAAVLFLVASAHAATASSPTASRGISPESFVGQAACDLRSKPGLGSLYSEPFDKDPSAFQFSYISFGEQRYILFVQTDPDSKACGKVLAAVRFDYPLGEQGRNEGISFNCAALGQSYDRYKAYLGVFEPSRLEYARAKRAWVLDINTHTLVPYKRVQSVFCPNFIAD